MALNTQVTSLLRIRSLYHSFSFAAYVQPLRYMHSVVRTVVYIIVAPTSGPHYYAARHRPETQTAGSRLLVLRHVTLPLTYSSSERLSASLMQ